MSCCHHQLQMELCDRGSLSDAIIRGVFLPSERCGKSTVLKALVRTAKEIAQVDWESMTDQNMSWSLSTRPFLALTQALPIQGLDHLHSMGITHGDLKPGNVLMKSSRIDRRGFTTRITDFGLAAVAPCGALDLGQQSNGEGGGIGTLSYSAPETLESPATPASDMWSFGVMLHEMVTGQVRCQCLRSLFVKALAWNDTCV